MQNLEQVRARNVLECNAREGNNIRGQADGEVVKKIPPIVMNHGFLAAAAYACDEKNKGWRLVFDYIAKHLSDPNIGCLPEEKNDLEKMLEYLSSADASSDVLKRATAEAMAWLSYARRFIQKKGKSHD